uniref:Phosphatidylinositol transfer protein n=1 Tax=Romanomermis culicivorax TaxID=13658 RepID=A0A915L7P2_ROMCU
MIIKEYRVILPITVEEYQVGQLFSVAEASKNETGGGEGIEVLKNEPYKGVPLLNGRFNDGQFTHKIYHLQSKVPWWVRKLAPKGSLALHEEAWNAYPYCKTVITNPDYMKDNFFISIETLHLPDRGETHNAHELTPEMLSQREVIVIDVANDHLDPKDYKSDQDPRIFKSEKTGRGPLVDDWTKHCSPVMTCYKLVIVEFKWWGFQNRVESLIQKQERRIFHMFHRQVFCWIDRWYGYTMDDIRKLEDVTKEELNKQRLSEPVRGSKLDD